MKDSAGTLAGVSCWPWTSWPGGFTVVGSLDDGGLTLIQSYTVPGTVGAIAPVEGDEGWILAAGQGFVHLSPDGSLRLHRRGRPGGDADERRRLRSAGPALGGHAG